MNLNSGIKGFDKVLGGGFPKNSIVLVIGGPGAGKSIFAEHYVYEGLKKGKKAVFLTFELNKKILLEQGKMFGIDLQEHINKGTLILKEYDMTKTNIVDIFKDLKTTIETNNPERVVIDSLSILSMYAEITAGVEVLRSLDLAPRDIHLSSEVLKRGAVVGLINMLRKYEINALLIAEMAEGHHYLTRDSFSEFLCDGVVKLSVLETSGKRYITVVKMRNAKHDLIPHKLELTQKGMVVKE
ncbi:hypothetical protein KO465_00665 [Candidatus Micrarchaeota archaeon]|nr:hypothetical protein [Candidatus Micrarchaeota archaeon]